MQISVTKKYVVVPLGYHARHKKIIFSRNTEEGKQIVYDVFAAIDFLKPDYYGYLDISRFQGETLELECDPALDYMFEMIDELPKDGVYEENTDRRHIFPPLMVGLTTPTAVSMTKTLDYIIYFSNTTR